MTFEDRCGKDVADARSDARKQHHQRLTEGNLRRWARWRAERGLPEPRRVVSNVVHVNFRAEFARRSAP